MHECFDQIERNAKGKMALRVDAAFFVSNQISISGATLFRFPRWVRGPVFEFSELQMGD